MKPLVNPDGRCNLARVELIEVAEPLVDTDCEDAAHISAQDERAVFSLNRVDR